MIKKFEKKSYPYFFIPPLPKYQDKPRLKLPIYKSDTYKCYKKKRRMFRYFNIINSHKHEVCKKAMDELRALDSVDLNKYL